VLLWLRAREAPGAALTLSSPSRVPQTPAREAANNLNCGRLAHAAVF